MWFQKKRKVLDLTEGERVKNILEKRKSSSQTTSSIDSTQAADIGLGGFFGSMSSAAEPSSSNYFSPQELEIADKGKIEEMENRLNVISRRLTSATDRLDLMEKKVDRLERGR